MSEVAIDPIARRLDVRERLEYAGAAVSVLRSLQLTDRTMQYGQFAQAIGLTSSSNGWKPWHRQQVGEILQIMAAVERLAGNKVEATPIEFARIVTKEGQPGAGVTNDTRIVSTPQTSSNSN